MDREIPKEEIRKRKIRRAVGIGVPSLLVAGAIIAAGLMTAPGVAEGDLDLTDVSVGTIEPSADASGKVVPAYELTITSPVGGKILELYCHEGEIVEEGQSLMRLDLASEETEMRKLADMRVKMEYEDEQAGLSSKTYLTNLDMQIRAKEMSVSRLLTELHNEKRLDSIGSGTGDRVREAELAYRTAELELEQLKTQLANERLSHEAARKGRRIEAGITDRNLGEMRRMLDDARLKAPVRATVTYLNSSLGTDIAAGERLAVLSDLSRFKILAEIAEGNSDKLSLGSRVKVRVGKTTLEGNVGTITPQSKGGVVSFTVMLDADSVTALKSGIRAEVNVVYDIKEGVVMIPNGGFYHGPGHYEMFVDNGDGELERRDVMLGESDFDHVEVKSGIRPGERVARNVPEKYSKRKKLKIKR